jgi:hypothetical protein
MFNSKRICLVQFKTHSVRIDQTLDGCIHCFKYDRDHCDMMVFSDSEQEDASTYIMTPLPSITYRVITEED